MKLASEVYNNISTAHQLILDIVIKTLEGQEVDVIKLRKASMLISQNQTDLYNILRDYCENKKELSDEKKDYSVIDSLVLQSLLLRLNNLDDSLKIDEEDEKEWSGLSIRAQKNVIKTALFWKERCKDDTNITNASTEV